MEQMCGTQHGPWCLCLSRCCVLFFFFFVFILFEWAAWGLPRPCRSDESEKQWVRQRGRNDTHVVEPFKQCSRESSMRWGGLVEHVPLVPGSFGSPAAEIVYLGSLVVFAQGVAANVMQGEGKGMQDFQGLKAYSAAKKGVVNIPASDLLQTLGLASFMTERELRTTPLLWYQMESLASFSFRSRGSNLLPRNTFFEDAWVSTQTKLMHYVSKEPFYEPILSDFNITQFLRSQLSLNIPDAQLSNCDAPTPFGHDSVDATDPDVITRNARARTISIFKRMLCPGQCIP